MTKSANITDPGLSVAVAKAVRHAAPFLLAELDRVKGSILIEHARDLTELRYLPNLSEVSIFAADVVDLEFVRYLSHLESLIVLCTPIQDLAPLAHHPSLEHLDVRFAFVRDAAPLLTLCHLKTATFMGVPWTEDSYRKVLPRLQSDSNVRLECGDEEDWRNTSKLVDKYKMSLCYGRPDNLLGVTVRPGVPKYTDGNVDFVTDEEFDVSNLLFALSRRPDDDREELLGKTLGVALKKSKGFRVLDFAPQREVGDAQKARGWIEASSLNPAIKSSLLRFVERFSMLAYYRVSGQVVDKEAAKAGVGLPRQFLDMRKTLTYVEADRDALIRFDHPTEQKHWEGSAVWFRLHLADMSRYDRERLAVQNAKILPYGFATSEHRDITLAINVSGANDPRVYAYFPENLDSPSLGPSYISQSVNTLFPSYEEFFDHIAQVKIKDGDKERIVKSTH